MDRQILGSREAAEYLGISIHQLYKLSSTRKIQTYSPTGGKIYFFKSELDEWISSGKRATKSETDLKAIKFLTQTPNRA